MDNHPLPKPSSLRAEDLHSRWYTNSRLLNNGDEAQRLLEEAEDTVTQIEAAGSDADAPSLVAPEY